MPLAKVSGVFRLGADPELRYASGSGIPVANIRAVATRRKKNQQEEWVDDKTAWVTLTAFKGMAENIAATLVKGMEVVVAGELEVQEWTDDNQNKRTSTVILLDSIGPNLAWATAQVQKVESNQGGGGQQQGRQQPQGGQQGGWQGQPQGQGQQGAWQGGQQGAGGGQQQWGGGGGQPQQGGGQWGDPWASSQDEPPF